ncbi:thiolase family protein [Halobacterium sp. KA-4]|uniref:thiolase family protein n=1 Tax=Halobacterium sp. KA-4 TaxID=2896367 RepID=UPI001E310D2C|nr:thiolase family protein [Halobacterium sp. KA-4]MCD2201704.1 thiolase family protein [Halobacterium sp. KA-4]
MTGVTISGVGITPFESDAERSALELATAASEDALDDAACSLEAVDSVHVGNVLTEALDVQGGLANAFVSAVGLEGVRADRIENTSASGASATHRGVEAVASGASDVAVVVGVEKMSDADTSTVTDAISKLTHGREYVQGITLPSFGGLAAGAYLDRYDAPREALAEVAVKNHENAVDNDIAQFQKEVSVEDALDSPVVADPLRLYDCCPMTDGAAAVVLERESDAEGVHVRSIGSATGTHAVAERPDPIEIESVSRASERTFADANLSRNDVDVACIHDAFTVLELLELEEIGFFERGTAWEATMRGETARDGAFPVNPGGGLKARGHPLGATGLSQVVELVWQLRGDLRGDRQVAGAETGFAVNVAGFGNNSVCTLLEAP